ncbi:orotidine-5'-phosphate decarboxylase [Endozoicomonas sp. GU-1]|uniref:orotidine-5'-phosphate decarboxylase n=1 Tax=Endozoicomonas sp. GU-1 TaxID=3009078 RepID=UPI0022B4193E|nr:orotidine-5'-phosphate decarboxylase [Endozoicomonas sp. GU-1]WBA81830.1 orotidine-5'-phosphate decarboxylase [Endozoicomonas sp. GU-1]WBA84785.1 orotidine-5'-phosphate decarboxylase [Endozoicomonas sp. GU-1]
MGFLDRVQAAMENNNTLLCVGLDPSPERFPAAIQAMDKPIFAFNKAIIDATADLVCCYKPQAAYYHAHGAEDQLAMTIDYIRTQYPAIPVILDSKRGDIGSTASQYAIEAFERYQADAVTVNPYMGIDTIEPFSGYADKGTVVLCRTSNPGAAAIQNLSVRQANGESAMLYEVIARMCQEQWNKHNNILLVVGATNPTELKRIRDITGDMTFLVPGLGAQGGDVEATVKNGLNSKGQGIIVNSSRGIIYASGGDDFAEAARNAAVALRDQVNLYR